MLDGDGGLKRGANRDTHLFQDARMAAERDGGAMGHPR